MAQNFIQVMDLSSVGLRVLRVCGRKFTDTGPVNRWVIRVGEQEIDDGGIDIMIDAELLEDVFTCVRSIKQFEINSRCTETQPVDLRKKKKVKK